MSFIVTNIKYESDNNNLLKMYKKIFNKEEIFIAKKEILKYNRYVGSIIYNNFSRMAKESKDWMALYQLTNVSFLNPNQSASWN